MRAADRVPPDVQAGGAVCAHPLGVIAQDAVIKHDLAAVFILGKDAKLPDPETVVKTPVKVGAVFRLEDFDTALTAVCKGKATAALQNISETRLPELEE